MSSYNLGKSFRSLSRAKQIAFFVFCAHGFIVSTMFFQHRFVSHRPTPTKIAVRTLPAPQEQAAPLPSSSFVSQQIPAPVSSPRPPKKSPSPPKQKKTSPKTLSRAAQQQELLQKMAKNFEDIGKQKILSPARPPLPLPKAIPVTAHLEEANSQTFSYGEALIAYLQSALELPEYGEVKVRLEIAASGHLMALQILDAQNKKNEAFLKKQLPELLYPCFNDFDLSEVSLTFTIVFRNVEIH